MSRPEPLLGRRFMYEAGRIDRRWGRERAAAFREFRENIESGAYAFEGSPCFCGSGQDILISETDRYGNYYPFVICRGCGTMRANPRMSAKAYAEFYSREYRTLYGDNEVDKERLYLSRVEQGGEVYRFISAKVKLPKGAVVFDIGCNMGAMLLPFSRAGCDVSGVDFDAEYIEFGRRKTGLDLAIGSAEKLSSSERKASLILLSHVVEHFLDIDLELRRIGALMLPGAHLYVSLPGTYWWITHVEGGNILGLLQNAHVWQFSLATLNYVMARNGFELLSGDERIEALYVYRGARIDSRSMPPAGECRKAIRYSEGS
jgi:2-polyprenyl-3-methyl-5-hydroxy-6-metoxy-1,4-benzoquinol methylase